MKLAGLQAHVLISHFAKHLLYTGAEKPTLLPHQAAVLRSPILLDSMTIFIQVISTLFSNIMNSMISIDIPLNLFLLDYISCTQIIIKSPHVS
jgi:hypothetical protein